MCDRGRLADPLPILEKGRMTLPATAPSGAHWGSSRCLTGALILVHSRQAHDGWVRLAETLPWANGRGLSFAVLTGNLQAALAERRERERDVPIGYIAADEPSVLEALAGGADEAAVVAPYDPAQLAAFVDRLELRARLRAESLRLQEAFAHAERLTALGTLVAGVGHEINNPLSAVMLSIEVARRRMLPALDAARAVAAAAQAGLRSQPTPWPPSQGTHGPITGAGARRAYSTRWARPRMPSPRSFGTCGPSPARTRTSPPSVSRSTS